MPSSIYVIVPSNKLVTIADKYNIMIFIAENYFVLHIFRTERKYSCADFKPDSLFFLMFRSTLRRNLHRHLLWLIIFMLRFKALALSPIWRNIWSVVRKRSLSIVYENLCIHTSIDIHSFLHGSICSFWRFYLAWQVSFYL